MTMSEALQVTIPNGAIARHRGYIYLVYSPEFRAAYVGQTASRSGALGRLSQHLGDSNANSFRQNVCRYFKYQEVYLKRVEFAAVPLSQRSEFHGKGRVYREAVENLVQSRLVKYIASHKIQAVVVSSVRFNAYCDIPFIQKEADILEELFSTWLSVVAKKV